MWPCNASIALTIKSPETITEPWGASSCSGLDITDAVLVSSVDAKPHKGMSMVTRWSNPSYNHTISEDMLRQIDMAYLTTYMHHIGIDHR